MSCYRVCERVSSVLSLRRCFRRRRAYFWRGNLGSSFALTLVAVPDGVKVHVVLVVGEEEEAEPRIDGVDGDNEEDPDDVSLLPGGAIKTQVHVDLKKKQKMLERVNI